MERPNVLEQNPTGEKTIGKTEDELWRYEIKKTVEALGCETNWKYFENQINQNNNMDNYYFVKNYRVE